MIKAYHQVGSDAQEPFKREALFDQVLELGEIIPATLRVARSEMNYECFTGPASVNLRSRFRNSGRHALEALEEMAVDIVDQLPEDGSKQTHFNCVDLLAGDLDRVFLSPGRWYAVPNGFVFDAIELLEEGAAFRPVDLLGQLDRGLQEVSRGNYPNISEARYAIEAEIQDVLQSGQFFGAQAVRRLKSYVKSKKTLGELVWDGPLPLDLAIEGWKEGKLVLDRIEKGALP